MLGDHVRRGVMIRWFIRLRLLNTVSSVI